MIQAHRSEGKRRIRLGWWERAGALSARCIASLRGWMIITIGRCSAVLRCGTQSRRGTRSSHRAGPRLMAATQKWPARSRASDRVERWHRHAEYLHYPMAKTSSRQEFHVICEKPLTTTLQEALDLATIVKRSSVILGLPTLHRHPPWFAQARKMIADATAENTIVQVEYAQDWLAHRWNNRNKSKPHGELIPRKWTRRQPRDIRHPCLQSLFVTGLQCREVRRRRFHLCSRAVSTTTSLMLRLAEGAKARYGQSVATGKPTICGCACTEKGRIEWIRKTNDLQFAKLGELPNTFAVRVRCKFSRRARPAIPAGHRGP